MINRFSLLAFDLFAGLPVASRRLSARLGWRRLVHAVCRLLWRGAKTDPFEALGPPASAAERFTRHQLRPVVLLYDTLRNDLGLSAEETLSILEEVVSETGARFIRWNIPIPALDVISRMPASEKRTVALGIIPRFGNAEAQLVEADGADVAFDVTFCHFVDLTRRLGRTELAPLFCLADGVYFGRPESPLALTRAHTIAGGAHRCEFRLSTNDRGKLRATQSSTPS